MCVWLLFVIMFCCLICLIFFKLLKFFCNKYLMLDIVFIYFNDFKCVYEGGNLVDVRV